MRITLLGTGTSSGIPEIGCECEVCQSADVRDKRMRTSILVETKGYRILIDCGPDFRQQMLTQSFMPIDAVLITHEHYDHIGGLDDLRPFTTSRMVDIYALKRTLDVVRHQMPYCFEELNRPRVPHIRLNSIEKGKPFVLPTLENRNSLEILPIEVMHGDMPILGYRIGKFAFITDMKTIDKENLGLLSGLECLVINGLRHQPHPTHQTIKEAVELATMLEVPVVRIVHLAHSAGLHAASEQFLPAHVSFGYDGEILEVNE